MDPETAEPLPPEAGESLDWQRRVLGRSLSDARRRSIDRGARLIQAAAKVLERTGGESLTVQEVADEAGQSLRTLYQYFESKDDLLLAVYEQAMDTYARIIRGVIAEIDDPAERLAAALLAGARMPALHGRSGVDKGLSRLKLQLGQADPALVARSQEPVSVVFRSLVEEAVAAEADATMDPAAAAYFVLAVRTEYSVSVTLGSEFSVEPPGAVDVSRFCLDGIGIRRERSWHEGVEGRLVLTGDEGRSILRRLAKGAPATAQTSR